MATTVDFIEYVCGQIDGVGAVRYKKMFGEYMAYVNDKPVLLVCDNTANKPGAGGKLENGLSLSEDDLERFRI